MPQTNVSPSVSVCTPHLICFMNLDRLTRNIQDKIPGQAYESVSTIKYPYCALLSRYFDNPGTAKRAYFLANLPIFSIIVHIRNLIRNPAGKKAHPNSQSAP